MITHYIRIAFRNIGRNRFYTLLNVLGLGVAIAGALVIYQYITLHSSYDKHHQKAPTTYKLVSDIVLEKTSYNEGVSYAMYQALSEKMAGIDLAAYGMFDQDLTFHYRGESFKSNKKAAFVDASWFSLFDFNWLSGVPDALNKPNTIALSASVARRIFGVEDAMGQTLEVEGQTPLTVVGVIDDQPLNTGVKSDFYIALSSMTKVIPTLQDSFFSIWGYMMGANQVYVSLNADTSPSRIESTLKAMTQEAFGPESAAQFRLKLIPLTDIHFDPLYGGTMRYSLLITLAGIGLGILIMAIINYVQLSLAQYAQRSAEIGTRKALGGSASQLFAQYMVESWLTTGIASLLAVTLTLLFIPLAYRLLFVDDPIAHFHWLHLAAAAIISWTAISVVAGLYPAWAILRIDVVRALKRRVLFGSTKSKNTLVVIQNTISLCLIIGTIIMATQVNHLQSTDVGFDRESVMMLNLPKESIHDHGQWRSFLDAHNAVSSYSFCLHAPANHAGHGGTLRYADRPEWESWIAKSTFADSAYLKTFDIALIAGRNFRNEALKPEYVINATMARQLGGNHPEDVLDKPLLFGGMYDQEEGTIVGIVSDYNTHSLHGAIEPTVIGYNPARMRSIAVKLDPMMMPSFITALEAQWPQYYPKDPLEFHFVDEQIAQLYTAESTQQSFIWIASLVAILISCLGLAGLISLQLIQRTKEIGIRKVLGASVSSIVAMLSRDFVKLVLLAILIASPLAWWAMNKWLEDFAYMIDIEWWMFALAGLLAIIIALLTVSGQAIRAAVANPVDSLRDE